jgi:hypothetical protein
MVADTYKKHTYCIWGYNRSCKPRDISRVEMLKMVTIGDVDNSAARHKRHDTRFLRYGSASSGLSHRLTDFEPMGSFPLDISTESLDL